MRLRRRCLVGEEGLERLERRRFELEKDGYLEGCDDLEERIVR